MSSDKDYNRVSVLVVGAGPAGLSAAITLKKARDDLNVCVIEKAADAGNHNLSGAVLEPGAIHKLLDSAVDNWKETEQAKKILGRKVDSDQVMFMPCSKIAFNIILAIKAAKAFGLGFGQMIHHGDYICSISQLTAWLTQIAKEAGVEIVTGFGVEDII